MPAMWFPSGYGNDVLVKKATSKPAGGPFHPESLKGLGLSRAHKVEKVDGKWKAVPVTAPSTVVPIRPARESVSAAPSSPRQEKSANDAPKIGPSFRRIAP